MEQSWNFINWLLPKSFSSYTLVFITLNVFINSPVIHIKCVYSTVQGSVGLHHSGFEDNLLSVRGDRVHALAVCSWQSSLLLPDAGPYWCLSAYAGVLYISFASVTKIWFEALGCWRTGYAVVTRGQWHSLLTASIFFPQDYLKKVVTPLFLHFENLTSNWTVVPKKHTDQWVHSTKQSNIQLKKD